MDLFSGKKVSVSQEERRLPYFKYYEQDMASISDEKIRLMAAPQLSPCVPFEERDLFLQDKDTEYCQIGYGTAPNGIGFVCNETYMPGVSGEMLDWWFPWHSVGSDLRYKIWDREDHYFARADRTDYVCNPGVPVHQKTQGVNHYILEDVGNGPDFVKLCFLSPESYGYDTSLIGTDKCESLVCAVEAGNCAAAMTHKWYAYRDGVMFCSRFWIDYALSGEKIICGLPEDAAVPTEVSKGLFAHNIKEFSNLAAILPKVYEENKDKSYS